MGSNRGLTTVRIPSLEDRVHGAIYRRDLLGGTWNRGVRHDRIGLRWLIDGFELQALVVDPKIRWFEVFRVAFVLVRAIAGLAGCPFPGDKTNHLAVKGQNVPPAARIVELRKEPGPNTHPCRLPWPRVLYLLFLLRGRAARAQEGSHHQADDDEASHGHDDDNHQDVVFTTRHPWFPLNTSQLLQLAHCSLSQRLYTSTIYMCTCKKIK